MKILALKPSHDGAVAWIDDGTLVFSYEPEKDSNERHGPLSTNVLIEAFSAAPDPPDIVAVGGWHKVLPGLMTGTGAGYRGIQQGSMTAGRFFGNEVQIYHSTHERSHIFGAVGMSPFDPDQDLAVLVWEGVIGSFYRWRGATRTIEAHEVLDQPGARYAALFGLADPSFPDSGRYPPAECAGKLMALAGCADQEPPSLDARHVVDSLLSRRSLYPFVKRDYRPSVLYNVGADDPQLHRAARYLSEQIFERFHRAAVDLFSERMPLVISGGCGLNCDWNTAWRRSGAFTDVFVPPCPDDSGSAIGTAIDAMAAAGARPTIEWDVYSGQSFIDDVEPSARGWTKRAFDPDALARELADGNVVAWVQGRCEIGPRALCHRSLLASATHPEMQDRLNRIKRREPYRPVAPVCLEEDLGRWFDDATPDPYMLHFRRVRQPEQLPAVTHTDGSARVQSVTAASGRIHELLQCHRRRVGLGVLCNTSLNFPGVGFLNRTSELLSFCEQNGVRYAVVDDCVYERPADPDEEVVR